MAADPNLPAPMPEPQPEPQPPARSAKLVCEFCECQLTPAGDVLRMSDQARGLSRLKETLAEARDEVKVLRQQLVDLQGELDAARAALQAPAVKPGFFGRVIE